jgi:outer membrane protein assembly factor BamB
MPSRRSVLAASASAVAVGTVGCLGGAGGAASASPGTDASTDWPLPDYDQSGTNYVPDAASPNDRPVVADETVYLPTRAALVALDATDGTERWRYATDADGSDLFRSPAVHDGTVYVTSDPGLFALDASDGTELWRVETPEPVRAAVAPMGEWDALFVGDDGGTVLLVALDGTVEWEKDVFGSVTRLVGDEIAGVVVGTAGGEVYRLYQGRGLWRTKVPGEVTALARQGRGSNDLVVGTFGGGVLGLRGGAHAGRTAWHAENGPVAHRGVALAADGVFAADLAGFARVDDGTGERAWKLGDDYGTAPAAAGDTVYVAGDGEVAAYKLGGGVGSGGTRLAPRRFTYDLGNRSGGHVAVADGALFVPVVDRGNSASGLVALE